MFGKFIAEFDPMCFRLRQVPAGAGSLLSRREAILLDCDSEKLKDHAR
jgi:hypothetical protein